jgi:hypothetical protein
MAGDERKFKLAWRLDQPVLEYVMWGYWSTADALAWKAAVSSELMRRPFSGVWYMCGDLSALKTQPDGVNDVRDDVIRLALSSGLAGCVMYGTSGVPLLQLRRLQGAAGRADQFIYVASSIDAEQQLRRWIASGPVGLRE